MRFGIVLVSVLLLSASCTDFDAGFDGGTVGEGEGEGEPGIAEVVADEPIVELGVVPLGTTVERGVTLRNRGTAPAVIVGASTSAPFAIGDEAIGTLLPGAVDTVAFSVTATPTTAETVTSDVTIAIEGAGPLIITARVTGACVPEPIIIAPESVLFGETATLDASTSVLCPGEAAPIYSWSIGNGLGTLSSQDQVTTSLTSDRLGFVSVSLNVFGEAGFTREASTIVGFTHRFQFQVTDGLLLGLEPHVMRATDAFCGVDDCFDGEGCGFTAASSPDWDEVDGRNVGDPFFDEVDGVLVGLPPNGTYVVAVYARESATAVATLNLEGGVTSYERALLTGDLWTIGRVVVLGTGASIEPIDTVEPNVVCE